jgi:hypothetical protein
LIETNQQNGARFVLLRANAAIQAAIANEPQSTGGDQAFAAMKIDRPKPVR